MSERSRAPDLGSEREVEEGLGDPFTAAFRGSRTPILITDPRQADNPIVFVNDAFTGLTGYAREEAIGRNCRFLQGPETDRAVVDDIRNAVGAGEGIETEILNYKIDWHTVLERARHQPRPRRSGPAALLLRLAV